MNVIEKLLAGRMKSLVHALLERVIFDLRYPRFLIFDLLLSTRLQGILDLLCEIVVGDNDE